MSISNLILPTQPMKSWNSTKTRPAHRELHALLFAINVLLNDRQIEQWLAFLHVEVKSRKIDFHWVY